MTSTSAASSLVNSKRYFFTLLLAAQINPCCELITLLEVQAGLKGVRIHDLRHSYASRALALGEACR